jgi:cytochrome c oxidase subunit 1
VRGREPLWENPPDTPVVVGLATHTREVLITTTHDAIPDHRYHMASDATWPVMLAVAVSAMWLGLAFHPLSVPLGLAAVGLILIGWFNPPKEPKPIHHPEEHDPHGNSSHD